MRRVSNSPPTYRVHHTVCIPNYLSPDLIIVLRDGQVVEQGSHEELLRRGGLYASMWQQQVSAELFDNEVLQ